MKKVSLMNAVNSEIIIHDFFFFFNDTATTEIYTLSLHDALPIWVRPREYFALCGKPVRMSGFKNFIMRGNRSEEHTPELQSQSNYVCRLLLEKKEPRN